MKNWTQIWHSLVCDTWAAVGRPPDLFHRKGGPYELCMQDFGGLMTFLAFMGLLFTITIIIWYIFKKKSLRKI